MGDFFSRAEVSTSLWMTNWIYWLWWWDIIRPAAWRRPRLDLPSQGYKARGLRLKWQNKILHFPANPTWNQKDGKRMKRYEKAFDVSLMILKCLKDPTKTNQSWLILAYMNCVTSCVAKCFTRSSQLKSTKLWASLSHIISKPFDGLDTVVLESMS